jgi:diaminopimelate decarboxylase
MTKPIGPIPAGFSADHDSMLMVGARRADDLAAEAGSTPLFVYDPRLIDAKIARFRASFAGIDLHFAMKANPYAPLLKHVAGQVDGIDLASGGELEIALEAGISGELMSFAGPGKRDAELAAAIRSGVTINLESEGEAERAIAIGAELGVRPRLAIRVNPDFEIKGSGMRMGGGAKPFGVDAERVPALVRRILEAGADWQGFHIFAGSQALSADALIEAQRATLELAGQLADAAWRRSPQAQPRRRLRHPYVHGDQPLDIEAVGAALREAVAARGRACATQNSRSSSAAGWSASAASI